MVGMLAPSSKADRKRWVNLHWKLFSGQNKLMVSSYSYEGELSNALL